MRISDWSSDVCSSDLYYSMPHLTRGHLGQRINAGNGGMDQARVREILHALLSALGYAPARGTIHRDVKAEHVLFDETDRPLLADFGIALPLGYGTPLPPPDIGRASRRERAGQND